MPPHKSLYTPIFYPSVAQTSSIPSCSSSSSSSSTASSSKPQHQPITHAYIHALKKTHLALASLPPSYEVVDEDADVERGEERVGTKSRVDNLRGLVEYAENDGGRGSGKWGLVWNGVRMGCTKYYRVSVPPVLDRKEEAMKWVLPETENEWEEWERKWDGEVMVKRKVESWKAGVEGDAEMPESMREHLQELREEDVGSREDKTRVGDEKEKEKGIQPRDTPLGFPVVKRSSVTLANTVKGGKKANGIHKESTSKHDIRPRATSNTDAESKTIQESEGSATSKHLASKQRPKVATMKQKPTSSPSHPVNSPSPSLPSSPLKPIKDLSEYHIPPSFPPVLSTSTPITKSKPPPIPLVEEGLPHLPSPSPILFACSSPMAEGGTSDELYGLKHVRERNRSQSRERVVKKARVVDEEGHGFDGNANSNPHPPPATPEQTEKLPTLTALIASSRRKSKTGKPKRGKGKVDDDNPFFGRKDECRVVPGKGLVLNEPKMPVEEERHSTPVKEATHANPHLSLPASPEAKEKELPRSPITIVRKSASLPAPQMVAFTQNPAAFAPPLTSSQPPLGNGHILGSGGKEIGSGSTIPGLHYGGMGSIPTTLEPGSSGMWGGGYNSQFDVEGQVDRVSELLERDVDFEGWLRDVVVQDEEEVEGDEVGLV